MESVGVASARVLKIVIGSYRCEVKEEVQEEQGMKEHYRFPNGDVQQCLNFGLSETVATFYRKLEKEWVTVFPIPSPRLAV